MQQGQVFELKKRAVDGSPVWAYRYRTDGPGSRRLQRGGFSSERDAAEALERALEHLRRQKGVGSTLTLRELVEEYPPNTTRNRRRSTSSAGCSPRRSVPSAAAAFLSFARKRLRLGG
jgi:hypothetical protein